MLAFPVRSVAEERELTGMPQSGEGEDDGKEVPAEGWAGRGRRGLGVLLWGLALGPQR